MNNITLDTRVGDLVADQPGRSRIFEHLGIDYCCGGKNSLRQACEERDLDPKTVVQMLEAFDQAPSNGDTTDWKERPLPELIDHIESTHHAYLRDALPRLEMLIRKVSGRHGQEYPWLMELRETFTALSNELEDHLKAEEELVFPTIRELVKGQSEGSEAQLEEMEEEHDEAGGALAKMRRLSDGYNPPSGACNSFRAMLQGLEELEQDMHRHVHKENNILFPRARKMLL